MCQLTSSEVDDDVYEEDGVREAVEGYPARAEVVVEEGDGDGQDDKVGDEQQQHAQVPVEPETIDSWLKYCQKSIILATIVCTRFESYPYR